MFLIMTSLMNLIPTVLVIAIVILVYIFEAKMIKKYEDRLSRWALFAVYGSSLILLGLATLLILWFWGLDLMSMMGQFLKTVSDLLVIEIPRIINSVIVLFVAQFLLTVSKLTLKNIGLKPGPNQKRKRTIARLIRSFTKYTIKLTAILIILSIWGINVAPALAGLGIMGLVIGLGAQRFINDLISGFFIIFENHFDVGDKIEVKGFKGEVIDIGLKTTKLKNWKGEVMTLNNGELTTFINFSKNPSVAVVEFGIAYKEKAQAVIELLNSELLKLREMFPEIIEDPKVLGVINLDSSSVNIRAIAKTANEQHYGVERAMRQRIKEILDDNGIEIPFPQVVVHQTEKK